MAVLFVCYLLFRPIYFKDGMLIVQCSFFSAHFSVPLVAAIRVKCVAGLFPHGRRSWTLHGVEFE